MFTQLDRLLDDCTEVKLKITRGPEGKLKVYVMPSAKNATERAAAQPQAVCGTPEELDEGFAAVLEAFVASRSNLAQQVQVTQAAHAKAAAGQTAAATNPSQTTTSRKPGEQEAGDDEDLPPQSQQQVAKAGSAAPTGTDMLSLFGEED